MEESSSLRAGKFVASERPFLEGGCQGVYALHGEQTVVYPDLPAFDGMPPCSLHESTFPLLERNLGPGSIVNGQPVF